MQNSRQQALILLALLINGCGPLTVTLQRESPPVIHSPAATPSATPPQAETAPKPVPTASVALDITKQVTIQVLNPTNKAQANWYKKNDKTIVMKVGATAEISATVVLKDGTQSQNVTWSSSDSTVAGVKEGRISANKLGVSTVLATSNLDASYKGLLNVEVVNDANYAASDSLSINNVSAMSAYIELGSQRFRGIKMGVNQAVSAYAIVTLSDKTKNGNVIWETSDERIALVDPEGRIQAQKPGVTTIVAKYRLNPDVKALIEVEVGANPVSEEAMGVSLLESSSPVASVAPVPAPTPTPSPASEPGKNNKPVIQYLLPNPSNSAKQGEIITLKVSAFDPDQDTLKYLWSATKGTLSANQGEAVSWRPQRSDGSPEKGLATITVIVDDGRGATESASVNITIEP